MRTPTPIGPTNCSQCRFWEQTPDEDGHEIGICRRFPPSYDGWAMSAASDWCGEFQFEVSGAA